MPSHNYYDVTVSREGGVFTAHIHISAEGKEKAKQKALEIADSHRMDMPFWTYDETIFKLDKPLIQVESVEIE